MNVPTRWQPPRLADIHAGIEVLRLQHPQTITLTISLKLRTTRFKERMLRVAQQHITNMMAELLETFRGDLAKVHSGAVRKHLINAIEIMLLSDESPEPREQIQQCIQTLLKRSEASDLLEFLTGIVQDTAIIDDTWQTDLSVLRRYLDHWHATNLDKQLNSTLDGAKKATKFSKSKQESTPKYTPERIEQIKYAILLRKALQQHHSTQLQTCRIAGFAQQAEQEYGDAGLVQQLTEAINKRSVGQGADNFIQTLCTCLRRAAEPHEDIGTFIQLLRSELMACKKGLGKSRRTAHTEQTKVTEDVRLSLIREVIRVVADTQEVEQEQIGISWLRRRLNLWFEGCNAQTQEHLTQQMLGERGSIVAQRIRYAVLLRAFLEHSCELTTATLLAVEIAEAVIREIGDTHELLSGLLSRCYSETCTKFKYPLSAVLRQSTFSKCGEQILAWRQLVIDYQRNRERKAVLSQAASNTFQNLRNKRLPAIYGIWQAQQATYRQAAETEVPIGPDVEKVLGLVHVDMQGMPIAQRRRHTSSLGKRFVGKRGARRIKKWLLDEKEVASTLAHLEVLNYPEQFDPSRVTDAQKAPHPYWTAKRRQPRSVKAVRPAQFQNRSTSKAVRLGQLTLTQRHLLQIQMRELKAYTSHFSDVKAAIEIFLDPAPPGYPRVDRVVLSERDMQHLPLETRTDPLESQEDRRRFYEQDLDLLRIFWPSGGSPLGNYTPEELYEIEVMRAQQLEKSAAALLPADFQPIAFHRTMSCELKPKSFTLLMGKRDDINKRDDKKASKDRYFFTCELFGEEAPERIEIAQRTHKVLPKQQEFLNYPGKHMPQQEESSLLSFALEFGDEYHGSILQELYERQKVAVVCKQECDFKKTGEHLPGCTPEAAITTATIVCKKNDRGHEEWYVHLPIPLPTLPCTVEPDVAIGVHEDRGRLYFAAVDLQGKVLDVGEVAVPPHVGPNSRKGKTSKNFSYEMALSIFKLSSDSDRTAIVGIEDTRWKRGQPDVDADQNRERFAFPRERIATIIDYKLARKGLLPPLKVRNVSPARDCGSCGQRLAQGGNVKDRSLQHCPHCSTLGVTSQLEREAQEESERRVCSQCGRSWQVSERQFKCLQCGKQRYAPFNTAIVVAQRTLEFLSTSQSPAPKESKTALP